MRQGNVDGLGPRELAGGARLCLCDRLPDPCGPPPAARPVIAEAITHQLIPVVRRQIARGGLRLARLLDEAFEPRFALAEPPARPGGA